MKVITICFLFSIGIILSLSLALALEEVARYEGSLNIGKEGGVVNIGPGKSAGPGCEEKWSCSFNSCINGEQRKICTDANGCGTFNLVPADNGIIQSCNNGGNNNGNNNQGSGGGGGGGNTPIIIPTSDTKTEIKGCIEDWDCSEWSACINGGQSRTCTDKNNCKTFISKPEIERFCENKASFENNVEPTSLVGKLLGAVIGIGASTNGKIIVSLAFLIIILVVLIAVSSPKKNVPQAKVNEVITAGSNNKVLNGNSDKK